MAKTGTCQQCYLASSPRTFSNGCSLLVVLAFAFYRLQFQNFAKCIRSCLSVLRLPSESLQLGSKRCVLPSVWDQMFKNKNSAIRRDVFLGRGDRDTRGETVQSFDSPQFPWNSGIYEYIRKMSPDVFADSDTVVHFQCNYIWFSRCEMYFNETLNHPEFRVPC